MSLKTPCNNERSAPRALGALICGARLLIAAALAAALCGTAPPARTAWADDGTLDSALGISREQFVKSIEDNWKDNYEGTRYEGWYLSENAYPSYNEGMWWPRGNPSPTGHVGMNCGGFVARALIDAGASEDTSFMKDWWAGYGTAAGHYANARTFLRIVDGYGLEFYRYDSDPVPEDGDPQAAMEAAKNRAKDKLLADGKAAKGDIIVMIDDPDDGGYDDYGRWHGHVSDSHIGIFWGDSPDDDKLLHSSHDVDMSVDSVASGCVASRIAPKCWGSKIFLIKFDKTGDLELVKTSGLPSITDSNGLYSLEGAVYAVYSGNEKVATITTGADGRGHASGLPSGTYTVKEEQAPRGYKPDGKSYKVTIASGQTTALSVTDTPAYESSGIGVEKIDGSTGEGSPQGAASLAGAEFTFKYYAGEYGESNLPAKADRTWVLKTGNDGVASIAAGDSLKVSGDDFFRDESNRPIVPLGTIAIAETKAPAGYNLDNAGHGKPKTYVAHIVEDESKQTRAAIAPVNYKGIERNAERNTPRSPDSAMRGNIEIVKKDAATKSGKPQGSAALRGAVYEIVNDNANPVLSPQSNSLVGKGNVVCEIVTDAQGRASTSNAALNGWSIPGDWNGCALPFGSYTIKEKSASEGYKVNVEWTGTARIDRNGATASAATDEDVMRGNIAISKDDVQLAVHTPQGAATLAGAVYEIVNDNAAPVVSPQTGREVSQGGVVCVVTTDEDGLACTDNAEANGWAIPDEWQGCALAYGTYTVREKGASTGYLVNVSWSGAAKVTDEGSRAELDAPETVQRGNIDLVKRDAQTASGSAQGDATLEGAVYEVVNANANPVVSPQWGEPVAAGEVVCEIVTDDAGRASTTSSDANGWSIPEDWQGCALAYGTYTVREKGASTGYELNVSWSGEGAVSGQGSKDSLSTTEDVLRGGLLVGKVDRQNGRYMPQGASTLAGALFEVTNDSPGNVVVDGTEYPSGAVVARMATEETEDGRFVASLADDALPYGTYTVRETGTSEGYLFDDASREWSQTFQIREGGQIVDLTSPEDAVSNLVIRGDFGFSKANEATMGRLGKVPFKITSNTTGEWHVAATDENGMLSTSSDWNSHESETNANDGAVKEDGTVDESLVKPSAGIWFNGRTDADVAADDSLGALPYDTYTVTELGCKANEGLELVSFEITISRNGRELDLGTVDDHERPLPGSIGTELTDEAGSHVVEAGADLVLVDTVRYENFALGSYTLEGELHAVGDDGSDEGIVSHAQADFTASSSAGEVEVFFEVPASDVTGRSFVAFERALDSDGNEVAAHEDIDDEGQTVTVVEIGTELVDASDGDHMAPGSESATLVDHVSYTGLMPGKPYTMTAELHERGDDGSDAGPVLDASGNPVTATQRFTPAEPAGTVDVAFALDASRLSGATVVAFEELKFKDRTYAIHADIEDEDQSAFFPALSTTAVDSSTHAHTAHEGGRLTITDTVAYENLVPGREYEVRGEVHVRTAEGADGGVLQDAEGNDVAARATFTPEAPSGTLDLAFEANVPEIQGTTVVFETLYDGEAKIASHEDIEDDGQSVSHPSIATTAVDSQTQTHTGHPGESVEIVDTVRYENLVPGTAYTLTGTLHAKSDDGEEIVVGTDGNPITSSVEFTPEAPSGSIDMTFTVDGTLLSGSTVVAFEDLSHNGVTVASHANIEDREQSIAFASSIATTAHCAETGSHLIGLESSATIVDTVSYGNLVPQENYVVRGELHALDDQGNDAGIAEFDGKPALAELAFTPGTPDGTVDLSFTIPREGVEGSSFVVFETLLSENETTLATHSDVRDEGQTVFVPKLATMAHDEKTGAKEATAEPGNRIVDTVSFANLTPGETYRLVGTLYDKATGKPLFGEDGPVTSELEFTPNEAAGTVDMAFPLDGADVGERTVVVFERLYADADIPLAAHEDIDSADQSVHYRMPEEPDKPKDDQPQDKDTHKGTVSTVITKAGEAFHKTGDFVARYWWAIAAIGVIGAIGIALGMRAVRGKNGGNGKG